jgi:hypothetical protein
MNPNPEEHKTMGDDERKHLDFIQAAITRMANNSFLIRGWSVTLVAGLFALAAKEADIRFVVLSYFPCLMFMALDTYYLAQERRFRNLYDDARQLKATLYDMKTPNVTIGDLFGEAFFSITIMLFHVVILAIIVAVTAFLATRHA